MEIVYPKLRLANTNNKLHCKGFVVINFPPATKFSTKDSLTVFQLDLDRYIYYVNIVNIIEVAFKDIGEWYTIPATGLKEGEWRRMWQNSHPNTTEETILAIYYYQRVN
jgi:hypothetical protein